MEAFSPPYYSYLLITSCIILIIYLLGHITWGPFMSGKSQVIQLFKKIWGVYIILVTAFALIWTKGNSIFLFLPFILGFYLIEILFIQKQKISINYSNLKQFEYVPLIGLMIFTIAFYTLSYYTLFSNNNGNVWCDYPVYASITHDIEQTQVEGPYVFLQTITTDKYHYSDIWPNVLFSHVFDLNYLHSYLLIVITLFAVLIFQGGMSIASSLGIKNILVSITFGLLLLIIQPLSPLFNSINYSFLDYPKLGGILIFLIASFIFYNEKNYLLSAATVFLLFVFYTPVTPGIYGGLSAIVLFLIYKKRIPVVNRYILYLFSGLAFYLLFYFVFNKGTLTHSVNSDLDLYWAIQYIAKIAGGYTISFFLSIAILFGLGYLLKTHLSIFQLNNPTFLPIYVFVISGFIFSVFAAGLYSIISIEGVQLIKTFIVPSLIIAYFVLVIMLAKNLNNMKANSFSFFPLI